MGVSVGDFRPPPDGADAAAAAVTRWAGASTSLKYVSGRVVSASHTHIPSVRERNDRNEVFRMVALYYDDDHSTRMDLPWWPAHHVTRRPTSPDRRRTYLYQFRYACVFNRSRVSRRFAYSNVFLLHSFRCPLEYARGEVVVRHRIACIVQYCSSVETRIQSM